MTQKKRRKKKDSKRAPRRPKPPAVRPRPHGTAKPEAAAPEIQTGYAPAGRETLAAIAEELGPAGLAGLQPVQQESVPEIEIGQSTAGRETLAAISDELSESSTQPERATLSYEDRPAPAATSPSASEPRPAAGRSPADAQAATAGGAAAPDSVPPPRPRLRTVGFSEPPRPRGPPPVARAEAAGAPVRKRPGRATLDAIEQGLAGWAETGKPPKPAAPAQRAEAAFEVFEMATFVVRGDLARLSSTTGRRTFVAERLRHRLPVRSMDDIDRIDVTPWTVRGTVVVRVWCRVPPA